MAQMKEQIKAPKIELNKWPGDSQPIRCRVLNTGNQDAHRNGWVWSQNRGKSEGYAKWNKEKYTGNQQWRKETGTQINDLEQFKEEINIQPEQNEETRIQKKNEQRLRNLQDNFKRSNIRIMGVPEGKEQEIENLFEQIMKDNFPNLAKEIRLPGRPRSSESPKEIGPKEAHTKAHHH